MVTLLRLFLALFLLPLAAHAAWWLARDSGGPWHRANWASARLLPAPAASPEASVRIYAARTGRWKGIFAHHTWIVVKPEGASRYTRYDVVGWGRPVRTDAYAPDGRWYGDTPRILLTIEGAEAARLIPRIRDAVAAYPHADQGTYVVWPGPNSNTFVAHVARAVPELAPALLPTAIGKDFSGWPVHAGRAPSGTGAQFSFGGLLGITVAWVEGFEVNVLGLVAGLDVRRPALKLPGWGRVGLPVGT